MSISIDRAAESIRRLEKMPNYPGLWTPLEREMIVALADGAHDLPHAESIVSRLMASLRYAPMPCNIVELSWSRMRVKGPRPHPRPVRVAAAVAG